MTPAMVVVVAVSNGEDESSCVLERMGRVVFKSCIRRPKSVIFEGLVRGFSYGVGGERKKKKKRAFLSDRISEKE